MEMEFKDSSRRRTLVLIVGVVLALVAGAGVFYLSSQGGEDPITALPTREIVVAVANIPARQTIALEQLTTKGKISKMVDRTRKGGGELVGLLGTSAWYAPGAAAAQMVDAICLDQKRVLPCTALLEGEYGVDGLYMGVPVRLGAAGVEEIVKLRLTAEEKKMLRESAAAVREVVGVLATA